MALVRVFAKLLFCGSLLLAAGPASAVTQYKNKRLPFTFALSDLTGTIAPTVADAPETVTISPAILRQRLDQSATDETIEPLTLTLAGDEAQIVRLAQQIALAGQEDALANLLRTKLKALQAAAKEQPASYAVPIDQEMFAILDQDAYAAIYSKVHHRLTLDGTELRNNRPLRRELLKQLSPFIKKKDRADITGKILNGDKIAVDDLLLPEFAHRMVRKYIAYRGPNCFHAALAFQSPQLTSSSLINVKTETGYHRAMINYDELWRVLNRSFYEVNPDEQPLKYGDMLVFFDVPGEERYDLNKPVDFRWIRHTATYLFSGYTFSKGSKSPNTPYTVRTVAEEWATWQRFTKTLGVKVFRRAQKNVRAQPPLDLVDWMY